MEFDQLFAFCNCNTSGAETGLLLVLIESLLTVESSCFDDLIIDGWLRICDRIVFTPRDAQSHLMHAFSKIQPPHSNMDNISYNDRIELAIADLESQDRFNYTAIAKKYYLVRTTLSRRHQGVIGIKE